MCRQRGWASLPLAFGPSQGRTPVGPVCVPCPSGVVQPTKARAEILSGRGGFLGKPGEEVPEEELFPQEREDGTERTRW